MIAGIGIDLVELDRIDTLVKRQPDFVNRILTKKEINRYETLSIHRQIEYLAGRFSAKEAFAKAMGTGIGETVSFLDIEVLSDDKNKPIMQSELFNGFIHVSISHSKAYAIAQVILEK